MNGQEISHIEAVISFIESHLDEKLDLSTIAAAAHYSKYHLHRMFSDITGLTVHDYVQRRQLSEAARLLVFTQIPILDIALLCGYESQQAFTVIFKAMYKLPPLQYRKKNVFYPLQLRFIPYQEISKPKINLSDIRFAEFSDIPAWMALVYLVIGGYPYFNETEYVLSLRRAIEEKRALILIHNSTAIGAVVFSYVDSRIEFLGVHPQYLFSDVTKILLNKLRMGPLHGKEISITTFREHDKADTGFRNKLKHLGFDERECLTEFGYPTQRFVLPLNTEEASNNEQTAKFARTGF